ncbi:mobilization protein [Flavobacteriaceae bacterium XHP0103]|uniref:MobB family relaxase n=1 Tax=Marixanthotalea marina TaxID=2844359 RepID=UPI002989CDD2|nr:MobB family relaxase [Marixanthotalea marina]MBU3820986.1 mobilization protein [Marixanthotalea marina]
MYITITPQKLDDSYRQSVADFVAYLEKENDGKSLEDIEPFFDQYGEQIEVKDVIHGIDANTAKLKKTEPKFYSVTLNPSQRELAHIGNSTDALKDYTRKIMEVYAKAFNREIQGRPITVDDITYYAKIEHQRTYKGTDKAIRENAPFYKEIVALKNEIQKIESGKLVGDIIEKQQLVAQLERDAPHKNNGKMIVQGMSKEGSQSHVHIIVSRKDQSNRYSLSPGSKYKASEVVLNGKTVKRGFDRDAFFKTAETTFDAMFKYNRNYVESYQARKVLVKNPSHYYAKIMGLPTNERTAAFKMLGKAGLHMPLANIPTNKVQLVLKAVKQLRRGMGKAIESGSIGL